MIPLKYNVRNLRVRWVTTLLTVLGTGPGRLVVVHPLRPGRGAGAQPERLGRPARPDRPAQGVDERDHQRLRRGRRPTRSRRSPASPATRRASRWRPRSCSTSRSPSGSTARGRTSSSAGVEPGLAGAPARLQDRPRAATSSRARASASSAGASSRRFKGAALGGTAQGRREGVVPGRRHLHRRRQRGRERGLGRPQGPRAEHRPRGLRLVRPAPRRVAGRPATGSRRRSTTTPSSSSRRCPRPTTSPSSRGRASSSRSAGTLIAVLLTFGAMFAAANTMFAAVGSRTREIGTMRALGFSRFDILVSFLGESVLLCTLGGLARPARDDPAERPDASARATSTPSPRSTITFRFGPLVMAVAFAMTLAMGVFGGLFPALRAVRLDVISALREL